MGRSQIKIQSHRLSNQAGQIMVESILIMTVGFGLFVLMTNLLKGQDVIGKIVNGPWLKTSAMIETGTWSSSPAEGRSKHPNTGKRGRTLDPN